MLSSVGLALRGHPSHNTDKNDKIHTDGAKTLNAAKDVVTVRTDDVV